MLSNNMQKGEYDSLHRKRSISTDSSSCWISRICEKRLISRVERTWQIEMTEDFWQGWHISHRRDCPRPFCDDTCPGLCSFHNTQSFRGNLQTADKLKSYKVAHLDLSGFHNWKRHLIDQKLIFLPFRIKQHDKHLLSPDSKSKQTVNMLFSKPLMYIHTQWTLPHQSPKFFSMG